MAGILDSVYLVAIVLAALIGYGVVGYVVSGTDVDTSGRFDWGALAVGVVFTVALGFEFLVYH